MNRVAVGIALALVSALGGAAHAAGKVGAIGTLHFSGAIVKDSCWSSGAVQQLQGKPEADGLKHQQMHSVAVQVGMNCPLATEAAALTYLSAVNKSADQFASPEGAELTLIAENGEALNFSRDKAVHQLQATRGVNQFQFKVAPKTTFGAKPSEQENTTLIYTVSYL